MEAAWEEEKMTSIDYARAAEQCSGEFKAFYEAILGDRDVLENVPQSNVPLLAGAAIQRAVSSFQKLVLEYMYPETTDADRIHNAGAMNSDMPFMDDHLSRVYLVGKVKAAKLREVTLYLVQKTAFLMTEAFSYAFKNMLKNHEMKNLIECLNASADASVEQVLRQGFVKHLLVHAQNAYFSAISDHHQFIHQVGAFCKEETYLQSSGVPSEQVRRVDDLFQKALSDAVDESLPPNFSKEFRKVYEGIQEGLRCFGHGTIRKNLPTLLGLFIKDMVNKKIITPESEQDSTPARGKSMPEDPDCGPKKVSQNHLLGMVAVSFAFFGPQFSEAAILRCTSGLLGSLNSTFHKHSYEAGSCQICHVINMLSTLNYSTLPDAIL